MQQDWTEEVNDVQYIEIHQEQRIFTLMIRRRCDDAQYQGLSARLPMCHLVVDTASNKVQSAKCNCRFKTTDKVAQFA